MKILFMIFCMSMRCIMGGSSARYPPGKSPTSPGTTPYNSYSSYGSHSQNSTPSVDPIEILEASCDVGGDEFWTAHANLILISTEQFTGNSTIVLTWTLSSICSVKGILLENLKTKIGDVIQTSCRTQILYTRDGGLDCDCITNDGPIPDWVIALLAVGGFLILLCGCLVCWLSKRGEPAPVSRRRVNTTAETTDDQLFSAMMSSL